MGTSPEAASGAAVLRLAIMRGKHYHHHHDVLWTLHTYCIGASQFLTLVVPFCLSAMLFVPVALQKRLNIVALSLSAAASILQFVPTSQKTKERALLLRELYTGVESATAQYQDGLITREALVSVLEQAQHRHAGENAP